MKPALPLQSYYYAIPKHVRLFLVRAIILFIAWKLLYHLVLFPLRTPDQQLTHLSAASTKFLYQHLTGNTNVTYADRISGGFPVTAIVVDNKRAVSIGDGCNGLELYILYIGLIFCIPTSISRQLLFSIAGIAVIFVANGFRCFGLAWLFLHDYAFADFAHHYLFKMVIYALMFYGWVLYAKKAFHAA